MLVASATPKPPAAPKSEHPDDLGFTPQPMVQWFSPTELVRAGVKALLSSLFGAYADYREVQAALCDQDAFDFSEDAELWIDYVADTGDGFDPTYAIARLVAEEHLVLGTSAGTHATQRGRILVFGGDQVYPTAKSEEYHNRLIGPFKAALPWVCPEAARPAVFAIPGNHDWYDGLTSFMRLFCQPRSLGAWETRQQRSYFAIKLSDQAWLWGLDLQLGSDIDQPQLDYFKRIAADQELMPSGSRVIVCVAEPVWVYATTKDPVQYASFAYFQREILHEFGHSMAVGLSGDLHTYARYQATNGTTQCFVAGGGGAYLYPSHEMPEKLSLPTKPRAGSNSPTASFDRKAVFPSVATSRRLTLGSLLFPIKNWRFSALLASIYLFYAWVWQSVSLIKFPDGGLMGVLKDLSWSWRSFANAVDVLAKTLAHSPGSVMLLALLVAALIAFADRKTTGAKIALGGAHALAHISFLVSMIWAISKLNLKVLGLGVDQPLQSLLFGVEMLLIGGIGGGSLMGLYLLLASRLLHAHANDVFSCQGIADYKHFLRLRLTGNTLTIYPIAIDELPKEWTLRSDAKDGEAWFEPSDRPIASYARLIEEPIVIDLLHTTHPEVP